MRKRGKFVRAIEVELGSARLCRRGMLEAGCRSWRADPGFKMVGNARGAANTTRASVFVYNHAYGVLAGEAGRFSLVGNYTTKISNEKRQPPEVAVFHLSDQKRKHGAPAAWLSGFPASWYPVSLPQLWQSEEFSWPNLTTSSKSGREILPRRASARRNCARSSRQKEAPRGLMAALLMRRSIHRQRNRPPRLDADRRGF